jgi:membrane protease YdiL (CAAX protease family)
VSTLESPERPAGIPDRRPGADRPWAALWAIPIAVAAIVAGGVFYLLAAAVRDALVDLPAHRDGFFGVALHGPPPVLTLTATLAQDLTLVAGAVLVAASALKGRLPAAALGLRPARLVSGTAFVVAGYLVFLLIAALWTSAMGIHDRENVAVDLGTRDSAAAFAAAGFLVCVVAPVAEELFFRGFLFGALRRRGLVVATLVSGVAFGLAHVASSPIGFIVPLAALGIILALLYERTGSLYPSMGLHALNNSIAFGIGDGRAWAIPVFLAAALAVLYGLSRVLPGSRLATT